MAFSVTPTSGDAPYNVSITFAEKYLIDNVRYSFTVLSIAVVGSCNTDVMAGTPQATLRNSLLTTGTGSAMANVPAGSCRTYSAIITDLSTDTVVSSELITVNNV